MTDRLASLRKKLAAREGNPGFKKNSEELRKEIARLEQAPEPTDQEIAAAWKAAEEARKSGSDTTSTKE